MTERLAFDTNAVIYFVERQAPYTSWLDPIFESVQRREREAVVSVVTEAEAFVKPMRTSNLDLMRKMRQFFSGGVVEVVEFTRELTIASAGIRADLKLELPDAIVVATALHAGCDALVGNDSMFSKRVSAIPYIHLDDAVRNL